MCGLGGVAALHGSPLPPETRPVLERMLDTLEHRGPDDSSIRVDGAVGLAFTRLSLVGLDSGNQPLTSRDEQVVLMANGEIYNHRALAATLRDHRPRTASDCEVLVGLYAERGLRFLDGVRGIYAVALHDKRRDRVVLATDPFATKPMFYAVAGGVLVFGSEIKALFDHPAVRGEIDWDGALADQSLSNFLAMSLSPVNTWFRDVRQVAAGTIVTVDLGTGAVAEHRYWQPAEALPEQDAPPATEYVDRYRELLWSAVEDSLMAEVEIGVFLSGGVDSTAIAAIAAKLGQPLHTFTVATEATALNGDVEHARLAAELLGLENTVATLPAGTVPSAADWKRLLWLMETPLAGPEQYYKFSLYRVAKQLRPGLKASLLGAGADEFNGGYTELLAMGGGWRRFVGNTERLALARVVRPELAPWLGQKSAVLLSRAALADQPSTVDSYRDYVLWKWRDVAQYNCWHEDRSAAGNGVEARVPFLDRRLVDLACGIPVSMREALLWDKRLARAAVGDILPPRLANREKKPFFDGRTARYAKAMVVQLLCREGMELVEEALAGPVMSGYVDAAALRSTVADLRAGRSAVHPEIALRLVNLGLLDIAARAERVPFRPAQVTLLAGAVTGDPAAVRREVGDRAADRASVLAFGPGTRFAHDPAAGQWLLITANTVTHTVAEDRAPEWIRFLSGVDGRRTAGELADAAGTTLAELAGYLGACLESGYLTARYAAPLAEVAR